MKWRRRARMWGKWACAVLAVVVVGLGVVSPWRNASVVVNLPRFWQWHLGTSGGMLYIGGVRTGVGRRAGWYVEEADEWSWWWAPDPALPSYTRPRFGCVWIDSPDAVLACGVTVVYPALLTSVSAALLWRWDIHARRRERVGLCPGCGYDLRGLPPGAACPECGKR